MNESYYNYILANYFIVENLKNKAPFLNLNCFDSGELEFYIKNKPLAELPARVLELKHLECLSLNWQTSIRIPTNLTQELPALKRLMALNTSFAAVRESGITKVAELFIDWATYEEIADLVRPEQIYGLTYNPQLVSPGTRNMDVNELLETIAKLNFTNLEYLEVTNMGLPIRNLTPTIGHFSRLKTLKITHQHFGDLPEAFAQLTALEDLDLNNNLFGEVPAVLYKLPNLKKLDISSNLLSESSADYAQMLALEELNLSSNLIKKLPESLAKAPRLISLNLMDFSGIRPEIPNGFDIDQRFFSAYKMTKASFMSLQETRNSASEMHEMFNTSQHPTESSGNTGGELKSQEVLLEEFMQVLVRMPSLQALNLSNNNLIQLPESSGMLTKLQTLDLSNNNITSLPTTFENLTNLKHLNCSGLAFSTFPMQIFKLTDLVSLNLSRAFNNLCPEERELSFEGMASQFAVFGNLQKFLISENNIGDAYLMEALLALPSLKILHIASTYGSFLPDTFSSESKLEILNISQGEMPHLNEFKMERLSSSVGNLKNLRVLNISNNRLTELPDSLCELEQLAYFFAAQNSLVELPAAINKLKSLETLDLKSNKLSTLPAKMDELLELRYLVLNDNHLAKIPAAIAFIPKLEQLDISSCGLRRLPKELFYMKGLSNLYCDGNPFVSPPREIADRGLEAVRTYFENLELEKSQYLHEGKLLIVGSPGAGKTTLRLKLMDANNPMPTAEDSTEGVDIEQLLFDLPNNKKFRMNIWDFGGQELYHSTHQFFFTRRSLYVLLLNTRRDDDRIDYWLHTINLFGGDSPVIIIQNQEKDRSYPLNEQRYRMQFPNIKEFIAVNLSDSTKIAPILEKIKGYITAVPQVGDELPASWLDVRERLMLRSKEVPYIDYSEFEKICQDQGLEEEAKIEVLSSYLHDLGMMLHFRDNRVLKHIVFLRNAWVIDAVYRVLDNSQIKNGQQGRFQLADLDQVWVNPEFKKVKDELLELMLKFEICFPLADSNSFLVPQLLSPNPPFFDYTDSGLINIRYQYDFMPRGLFTRFIVQMHYYISDPKLIWKEGVILQRLKTMAKVTEDYDNKILHIQIAGERSKELLAILSDEFERLHKSFPEQLNFQKLIPCNCSLCSTEGNEPYLYDFKKLQGYLDNGRENVVCDKSYKDVQIRPLLDGIQNPLLQKSDEDVQILFVAANPKDTQPLELDREVEMLREVVESGRHQDQIRVEQRWEVSFDKLQQMVLKTKPQIIHFSGHGTEKGLILENASGTAAVADGPLLDSLFAPLKSDIYCIILNACYSENQASVIAKHITFVVGMNTAISDKAALLFTKGFYRGLANRLDIEFAFSMGISMVQSERPDQVGIFELWKNGEKAG